MPRATTNTHISTGIFVLWGLAVTVPSVALLAHHLSALPNNPRSIVVSAGNWQLRHFLGDDCGCSSSIADNLLQRGPTIGVDEHVTFIGNPNALTRDLQRRGFAVECVPAAEAETQGVVGAPWLLIHEPAGKMAYSGGYAEIRPRPGVPFMDLTLLSDLRGKKNVRALPSFGCATSDRLRRTWDPLGLKYSSVESRP